VASLPLLAVEAIPDGIIALLLASVWVVGGVTAPRIALGGFATSNWVLVVSALAVGGAIASSGLLYRMALWVVASSRGGYAGQVVGLGVSGMLIGPAVPNATSRVALVAPAVSELIDAMGYRPGSRPSIGLAMATLIGFGQIVALFLTSSTTSVLVYAVLPETTRASVSWGSWALRSAPTHLLLFAGMAAFILWRYRPHQAEAAPRQASSGLALQRALLGPPTRPEKIAIAITVLLLVGFSTQPLHHVDPAWIGVLALAVLAGTGVLAANGLSNVNWSFALLSGILTSMSDVFADTQLDKWLAGLATQTIGGLATTPVVFVAALTLLCYALSLVMRWQAAAPFADDLAGASRSQRWHRSMGHRADRVDRLQRVLLALSEHHLPGAVSRHKRPSVQPSSGAADGHRLCHRYSARPVCECSTVAGIRTAVGTKQRGSATQHAPSSA